MSCSPTENKTISNANHMTKLFFLHEVQTAMLVHNEFPSRVSRTKKNISNFLLSITR